MGRTTPQPGKSGRKRGVILISDSFLNLVGTKTAGANLHFLFRAVWLQRSYCLKVGLPSAPGFLVRMADIISRNRTFAAYITFVRHNLPPIPRNEARRHKHII